MKNVDRILISLLILTLLFLMPGAFNNHERSFVLAEGDVGAACDDPPTDDNQEKIYNLELNRWNIYDDGTHPKETTKGFNDALEWAHENNYTTFSVPKGTFLIDKGEKDNDPNARINLVPDITFEMTKDTVLVKEPNKWEQYSLLFLDSNDDNVTIIGGTLKGDRDKHDYTFKGAYTSGTHEWGNGINIKGADNLIVDNVSIQKFSGDGIEIGAATITGSYIKDQNVEEGSLNDKGQPIDQKGKIRSVGRDVTNFDNKAYEKYDNVYMWLPNGLKPGSKFDIFYYRKDNSFIKSDKNLRFFNGESTIPDDADYFRTVFEADDAKGVSVNRMTVDLSENIKITNSDIGYNRRQGITVGGSDNVEIAKNKIHHTSGTSPQAGIDIEPGFFPARNTFIKENDFDENKIQIVLAYGENAVIEKNNFKQTQSGTVGVHIHEGYRNATVQNNNFEGSGLTLKNPKAVAAHNTFNGGTVTISGEDVTFKNAKLTNTKFLFGGKKGQSITNVETFNTGKNTQTIYVGSEEVSVKNLTVHADEDTSGQRGLIFGVGNNDSTYDDFSIFDKANRSNAMPRGTYTNSTFETGPLSVNREGEYIFDNITIKSDHNLFRMDQTYGDGANVTIKNSNLETTSSIGYGAAIYILGAKEFNLLDSKVSILNNDNNTAMMKVGPYGYPKPTKVHSLTVNNTTFESNRSNKAIDTLNSGSDAPPYHITNNKIINATLALKETDIN